MTRVKSISDIGLVYEAMIGTKTNTPAEVVEEKVVKKLNTFPKAEDKKINVKKITSSGSDTKAFFHKDSGPEAASGFNKNIVDPKTAKKDNHYEPQKFSTALEKNEHKNINNNMSKSIFDKLYEDVMKDDALDLGIQAGPEGEAGDKPADVGGESDEVTITLSRELAQTLHDVLAGVIGGESEDVGDEDFSAEGEDLGVDSDVPSDEDEQNKKDDKKDEEEEVAGEATELHELPDSKGKSLQGKNNKVPGKLGHAKGSKASGDIKASNDGKLSPLPDSKGHSLTSKNNKVNAPGYKPGDLFK